jgi:hypothetical protein
VHGEFQFSPENWRFARLAVEGEAAYDAPPCETCSSSSDIS